MHARRDPGPAVDALAAAQCGMLAIEQVLSLGLGHESVRRLVAQKHWRRVAAGVYDTRPGSDSFEKRAWAALLRAGEPSAVGGDAALRLHGLSRGSESIVVWVPADRRPRSDQVAHIRRDFSDRVAHRSGLLSRIRAQDAVVDVAEGLALEAAVSLISEAMRRRLVTTASLRSTVLGRARVRNRARLLALIADLDGIESTLEYVYRRDVERAHGLPAGRRQRSFSAGTRSDVAYVDYGVLVELDGKVGHLDTESTFRDLNRDNAHAVRNLLTLRYGSADVRGKPCEVARQVSTALRVRGWPGVLESCHSCRSAFAVGF